MGRSYVYECDSCKKVLGNDEHIHIKNGGTLKTAFQRNNKWYEVRLFEDNKELHFCDEVCLGKAVGMASDEADKSAPTRIPPAEIERLKERYAKEITA